MDGWDDSAELLCPASKAVGFRCAESLARRDGDDVVTSGGASVLSGCELVAQNEHFRYPGPSGVRYISSNGTVLTMIAVEATRRPESLHSASRLIETPTVRIRRLVRLHRPILSPRPVRPPWIPAF